MHDFIRTLKQRYDQLRENGNLNTDQTAQVQRRLNALRLADAALTKQTLIDNQPDHTLHIGILGPTQAGKSTLVNLLSDTGIAGVSPLAGYTVHAQGFYPDHCDANDVAASSASLFPDFTRVEQQALESEQLNTYSLQAFTSNTSTPVVYWDSPDFDSVESRGYRTAVLRVAALADVLILMTSKDKYADKTVWDMLALLLPLRKPLLVCINKLSAQEAPIVTDSFLQRFNAAHSDIEPPRILTLPFVKGLDGAAQAFPETERQTLSSAVQTAAGQVNRNTQKQHTLEFIEQHWSDWLEPVHVELEAAQAWSVTVDNALEAALQHYRSGFLDHPAKYDTFNRALGELLNLLEVPGLASTLGTTRKIVTWPIRKIFNVGRSVIDQESADKAAVTDLEMDVLQQTMHRTLGQLSNGALEQSEQDEPDAHWWGLLFRHLRSIETEHQQRFEVEVQQYQEQFAPEIESAAHELYQSLQQQPALLNTLRAARVSTDAAAVVLAVKSGGLAATDLVLAPAMLSLTTMLTEGALGKYMDTVKASLQNQQEQQVRSLLSTQVRDRLLAVPEQLSGVGLIGIDADTLATAEQDLSNAMATPS